jgi:hypothetical protein
MQWETKTELCADMWASRYRTHYSPAPDAITMPSSVYFALFFTLRIPYK